MPRRPVAPTILTATSTAISALAAALLYPAACVHAAEMPSSLEMLLTHLPELPTDVQQAATWVDKPSGRVVQPKLAALQSELQAHLRAMEVIAHADDGRRQAEAGTQVKNLAQGMASIGIDFERMQRDPAYAHQVQENMRSMSPEQLLILSQQMNQSMQGQPRQVNEAVRIAEETPAVRAAGDAGFAYTQAQTARIQSRQLIWREANERVAGIVSAPLKTKLSKPRLEWGNPGCDQACNAGWQAYADEVLPLMITRENEALLLRRATLQKLRNALAAEIQTGDRQLAAAQYGVAAKSQDYQLRIAAYDAALVGEIRQLADWTAEAVRPAATLAHCGKQAVLAPGAVCP